MIDHLCEQLMHYVSSNGVPIIKGRTRNTFLCSCQLYLFILTAANRIASSYTKNRTILIYIKSTQGSRELQRKDGLWFVKRNKIRLLLVAKKIISRRANQRKIISLVFGPSRKIVETKDRFLVLKNRCWH